MKKEKIMKKDITKQLEGTQKDEDGKIKGKGAWQKREDRAVRILNARAQGKTLRKIADDENVSYQRVQQICTGKRERLQRSFKLKAELTQQLELAQKKLISAKENSMTVLKNPPHTSQGEIIEGLIEEYLPVYLEKHL